jgi:hypothetical protein
MSFSLNFCLSVSELTERERAFQTDGAAQVKDLPPYFPSLKDGATIVRE